MVKLGNKSNKNALKRKHNHILAQNKSEKKRNELQESKQLRTKLTEYIIR